MYIVANLPHQQVVISPIQGNRGSDFRNVVFWWFFGSINHKVLPPSIIVLPERFAIVVLAVMHNGLGR